MLIELIIQNIVLIDESSISFKKGFNVLSGETGSGKSGIVSALQQALGARTDISLIRHGKEKAIIEAIFDIQTHQRCQTFLTERGITIEDPSLLILKREITLSGKTRAFINHQAVQISVLRQVGEYLIEFVSQHANHRLFRMDQHREYLDLYGNLADLRQQYYHAWHHWQKLQSELQQLQNSLPSHLRDIETCEREILEIETAHLQDGEEECLFEEYNLLSSAQERLQAAQELNQILEGEKGIRALLIRAKHPINSLTSKDSSLTEVFTSFPQVLVEIDEMCHSLHRYITHLEPDPKQIELLNKRLVLISQLKKKYGSQLTDIHAYLQKQKMQLHQLHHREHRLRSLETDCEKQKATVIELAQLLTDQRKELVQQLSQALTHELKELKIHHALFSVHLTPRELNQTGADHVEFFLSSNLGERCLPLQEGISGGELARVLLALHVLLAGKEGIPTLIFDEVDANIGGNTATLIGQKLQTLGNSLQILCITHFPQVAKYAQHHLQISKAINQGRTFTQVTPLTAAHKKQELSRMMGKST